MLKQLRHYKRLIVVLVIVVLVLVYNDFHQMASWHESPEKLPLFRDLYTEEAWPDIQGNDNADPDQLPRTVHYLWCGHKQFRFQHYLGLLSAIRLLRPLQIVIHYTHLPAVDTRWYNVWFQEMKQSLANLELQRLETVFPCGSRQLLDTVLGFLANSKGGFFIGENVVLTRFPDDITRTSFWFCLSRSSGDDATQGIAFSRGGFDSARRAEYLAAILSTENGCSSRHSYNDQWPSDTPPACLTLTENIYPRDIWAGNSPFSRLARWLLYGSRQELAVRQTTNESSIPRVGHMTWLNPEGVTVSREFQFLHFLSVLSALHVAGLRHVYLHGDLPPRGVWWQRLKDENVSFVSLHPPRYVFQQKVRSLPHRSDILRAHILHKHGGVYQDSDVVWVSRLPDWLLRYPTVVCPDWPRNGEWPETFNTGVLMSQSRAPWLRHFLSSLRYFLDHNHAFNAVMMSYRTYERHPDSLYIDRNLQVICFRGICHPVWHNDYRRDIDDVRPPKEFDWRQARAFHFTVPKPPAQLSSPEALRTSSGDMFTEIGRHILAASGWAQLVDGRERS